MKWLKNSLGLILLFMAFFWNAKTISFPTQIFFHSTETVETTEVQKQIATTNRVSEPQISVAFKNHFSTNPCLSLPIYQFTFGAISLIFESNPFSTQDIDRCLKVSVLLFPYHFYW
jgi:hypothetical protein